jgi:hypothetical protein
MKKNVLIVLPLLSILIFCAQRAAATANYVYHEQSNNFAATPTCPSNGTDSACGHYVENADRDGAAGFQIYSTESYTLRFKVEFQNHTNEVRVYYTTDGSAPCGAFGVVGNVTQPDSNSCGAGNTTQVPPITAARFKTTPRAAMLLT